MRLLAIACASLALAGCAQVAALTGVPASTVQTVHVSTGQALTLAYDSLDSATLLVEAGVTSGVLHGPNATAAANDLTKAKLILDTAYAAYHAGTAVDVSSAIADTASLLADAKQLAAGR